jgi:hypothetical protein
LQAILSKQLFTFFFLLFGEVPKGKGVERMPERQVRLRGAVGEVAELTCYFVAITFEATNYFLRVPCVCSFVESLNFKLLNFFQQ